MCPNDVDEIANSVDPNQTAPSGQCDLGLHCLPRPVCPNTLDHYSNRHITDISKIVIIIVVVLLAFSLK